ncbi:MAG: membrane protein insertion efficiency factor YidD [Pseudomonadota bacterium]
MHSRVAHWSVRPLIAVVKFYRLAISPWLGRRCRYEPTCSSYAIEALEVHGLLRGTRLTARRLSRCHPWGGSGWDPVPPVPSAPEASPRAAVSDEEAL